MFCLETVQLGHLIVIFGVMVDSPAKAKTW